MIKALAVIVANSDTANNIYGIIGLTLGSISGIIVAIINNRSKSGKESARLVKVIRLERKAKEDLAAELDSLKKSFRIVFEEMERDNPKGMSMLKSLKDHYNL